MSAEHEIPGSARSGDELDRPSEEPGSASGQSVEHPDGAVTDSGATAPSDRHGKAPNMLPGRERRRFGLERLLVRLIATCGIVGIGVAIAAIMVSSNSKGWLVGLVVSVVSVVLSAVLWSSRSV
jgi:hypothetical protein